MQRVGDIGLSQASIYRLSSRVVAMAKFRALSSCIHDWDPAPGSPVRRPGCGNSSLRPGIAVESSTVPMSAPAQSICLCSARCCCSAAWKTLALEEGECGRRILSTPPGHGQASAPIDIPFPYRSLTARRCLTCRRLGLSRSPSVPRAFSLRSHGLDGCFYPGFWLSTNRTVVSDCSWT
jgi:hypothetical protein